MPGTGEPLQIVQSALGDDAILFGGLALLQQGAGARIAPLPSASHKTNEKPALASVDKPLERVK